MRDSHGHAKEKGFGKRVLTGYHKHTNYDEVSQIWRYFRERIQDEPKFYKHYIIMRLLDLGLRVGEVTRLIKSNFSSDFSRLIYITEKTHKTHERVIPDCLSEELRDYVETLPTNNEFMFPIRGHGARGPYVSTKTVQYEMMKARSILGLGETYAVIDYGPRQNLNPSKPEKFGLWTHRKQKLNRLTPHTNRHHEADRWYELTKDPVAVASILGIDTQTAMSTYISPRQHIEAKYTNIIHRPTEDAQRIDTR